MKSRTGQLLSIRYVVWWLAALLTFLLFDIEWCMQTSMRPFTYRALYICLFAASSVFSLPAGLSHRTWPQATALILTAMLLIANLMYSRTYYTAIPLQSYAIASNLRGFSDAVVASIKPLDLIILLPGIFATIADSKLKRTYQRPITPLSMLVIGLLAAVGIFQVQGGFKNRIAELQQSVEHYSCIAPVYTIFSGMIYDAMTINKPLTEAEKEEINQWFDLHQQLFPADTLQDYTPKKSLAIILCESLESWPIGLSVEGQELTPELNKIIADTAVYYAPNVVTQVRDGRSIDAQLLYLAGFMPPATGVYSIHLTTEHFDAIPAAMKSDHGAKTLLFSLDSPQTWNQRGVANAFGIDSLYMSSLWPDAKFDAELFSRSINILESRPEIWPNSEPTFAMWVTKSGHTPFVAPADFHDITFTGHYPQVLHDYMVTTRYVDTTLPTLIQYLRTRPDAEDITIVILGDHEALATNRRPLSRDYEFVSSQCQTPLIMINGPRAGVDSTYMGQVDIHALLCQLVGTPIVGMGVSPFSAHHPRMAVGSFGDAVGEPTDSVTLRHLRRAYIVSDRLLRK